MMNKEALDEVINYTEVWNIIHKTDLLNYDEKDKLHLYLMNFRDNYKDLQQRISKAIEYMKTRFMNCIDNDKRYFEDYDIQQIYEILKGVDNEQG